MPETQDKTVYRMIRDAIDKGDTRFHRRIDAYWLKQYVKDAEDYDNKTDAEWDQLAKVVRETVTERKRKAIQEGLNAVTDGLNTHDRDLVIEALSRTHAYLFNELVTACFIAIKDHFRRDGRVSLPFQELAEERF